MALIQGDCLEEFNKIKPGSIDLVLCDPPYGTTQQSWDKPIDFKKLWESLNVLCKDNAAILLFAANPFDKYLAMSNIKMYKYDWVWVKNKSTGHLNANRMPLKKHEYVLVFYKTPPTYNPQKSQGHKPKNVTYTRKSGACYGNTNLGFSEGGGTDRYPDTALIYDVVPNNQRTHPNEKPTSLLEYLIATYSNPGDTVLDFAMGSGSTGEACYNTKRNFIGIEKESEYFKVAEKRITTLKESFSNG